MIKCDTLKISLPIEIAWINKRNMIETVTKSSDNKKSKKHFVNNKYLPFGINTITQDEKNCVIELSAKILKEDYLKGLSIDTIEEVYETLCPAFISVSDIDDFLEYASVYRVHVNDNLKMEYPIDYYIQSLGNYPNINSKYKRMNIENESLYFMSKNVDKRYKNDLGFYDKLSSMHNNEVDRRFLGDLKKKNGDRMLKECKNVLRVEKKMDSFEKIRDSFNLKECKNKKISLLSILDSKENPILKHILEILNLPEKDIYKTIKKKYLLEKMKPKEKKEFLSILVMLKNFKGNVQMVKAFFDKRDRLRIEEVLEYLYDNNLDATQIDLNNIDSIFPDGQYNWENQNKACINEILTKLGGE